MKNRTDWFKEAGYGIFVHWTTNSLDKDGNKKEYFKAVEDFDIDTRALNFYLSQPHIHKCAFHFL